jgi:hypothetical protein
VRLEPPLDPTSPQARQWLEDELRKGIYHEQKGLLERIWDWLMDLLSGAGTEAGGAGLPGWTVWIAVLVIAAVVALVLVRSVHAERRMKGPRGAGVLEGPTRTAAEHRAAAAEALDAGDADTAVLEAYRALTRSAIERTLLDDLPGRTAHEVAVALGPVFPASASSLALAADTFDAVRYGRRAAGLQSARDVVALDAELARTRPLLPDPATAAAPR